MKMSCLVALIQSCFCINIIIPPKGLNGGINWARGVLHTKGRSHGHMLRRSSRGQRDAPAVTYCVPHPPFVLRASPACHSVYFKHDSFGLGLCSVQCLAQSHKIVLYRPPL